MTLAYNMDMDYENAQTLSQLNSQFGSSLTRNDFQVGTTIPLPSINSMKQNKCSTLGVFQPFTASTPTRAVTQQRKRVSLGVNLLQDSDYNNAKIKDKQINGQPNVPGSRSISTRQNVRTPITDNSLFNAYLMNGTARRESVSRTTNRSSGLNRQQQQLQNKTCFSELGQYHQGTIVQNQTNGLNQTTTNTVVNRPTVIALKQQPKSLLAGNLPLKALTSNSPNKTKQQKNQKIVARNIHPMISTVKTIENNIDVRKFKKQTTSVKSNLNQNLKSTEKEKEVSLRNSRQFEAKLSPHTLEWENHKLKALNYVEQSSARRIREAQIRLSTGHSSGEPTYREGGNTDNITVEEIDKFKKAVNDNGSTCTANNDGCYNEEGSNCSEKQRPHSNQETRDPKRGFRLNFLGMKSEISHESFSEMNYDQTAQGTDRSRDGQRAQTSYPRARNKLDKQTEPTTCNQNPKRGTPHVDQHPQLLFNESTPKQNQQYSQHHGNLSEFTQFASTQPNQQPTSLPPKTPVANNNNNSFNNTMPVTRHNFGYQKPQLYYQEQFQNIQYQQQQQMGCQQSYQNQQNQQNFQTKVQRSGASSSYRGTHMRGTAIGSQKIQPTIEELSLQSIRKIIPQQIQQHTNNTRNRPNDQAQTLDLKSASIFIQPEIKSSLKNPFSTPRNPNEERIDTLFGKSRVQTKKGLAVPSMLSQNDHSLTNTQQRKTVRFDNDSQVRNFNINWKQKTDNQHQIALKSTSQQKRTLTKQTAETSLFEQNQQKFVTTQEQQQSSPAAATVFQGGRLNLSEN